MKMVKEIQAPLIPIINQIQRDSNTQDASNNTTENQTTSNQLAEKIYFENGTCKCPNATIGFTATISGGNIYIVDNNSIKTEVSNGNVNFFVQLSLTACISCFIKIHPLW